MKKLLIVPLLLLIPFLLLGCSADSLQTANVEAADPVVVERPTEEAAESQTETLTAEQPAAASKDSCAVTQPPKEAFIPPQPYGQAPSLGYFFYGTEALWTSIPDDQTWRALPYDPEKGFGQKVFYQRAGYNWMDEPEPSLTVSGRRLDGEAPPLTATRATNGYTSETESFILVGVEIPTTGCWELTAEYEEDTLTFVIWVAP